MATVKKQTSGVKTGLLALGIVLIIGAFIFISVLFFKKNEKKPEDKEPTIVEKGPVGDFEFTHEVEKIEVKSQSSEYNTNIVDVNVNLSEDEQKEIEYIYISNVGYGQEETRYFADEQIIDWPIAEAQDGQEHTVYITIVDKNGDVGRESATYKVDLR